MSGSSTPSIDLMDNNDVDIRTLPRIGGMFIKIQRSGSSVLLTWKSNNYNIIYIIYIIYSFTDTFIILYIYKY